jgi:hypothetical protein
MTVIWLTSVLVFVALSGFKASGLFLAYDGYRIYPVPTTLDLSSECANCWRFYFTLSDKVLIAFITSTTASVIGIFIIVAKWLFPPPYKIGRSPAK